MPTRKTVKYLQAMSILSEIGHFFHSTQDELYDYLTQKGYYWDRKSITWEKSTKQTLPASKTVKIRVWTGSHKAKNIADSIVNALDSIGLKVSTFSKEYRNDPPDNNNSRIYLEFLDEEDS